MDSGVPQDSVLGPGLFLYYINNLQSRLTSTVRLFADDTIAYLTISHNNDAEALQKDLDKLGHWENEWCMKFHPDKCTVLRVTNKKKTIDAKYQLHGQYARVSYIRQIFRPHVHKQITMGLAHKFYYQQSK